jgi:hypothetical protein
MCLLPGLFEFLLAAMETGDSARIQQNTTWIVQFLALDPSNTQEMYECAGLVEALERKALAGDFAALQTIHSLTSNPVVPRDIYFNRASLVSALQANPEDTFAKLALVNIFGADPGTTCVDETLVRFVAGTLLDGAIEGSCVWKLHHPLCAIGYLVSENANAKLVLDQPYIIERLVCAAELGHVRGEPDAVYLACLALYRLVYRDDQSSAKMKLKLSKLRAMETDIMAKPHAVWGKVALIVKELIVYLDVFEEHMAKTFDNYRAPAVVHPVAVVRPVARPIVMRPRMLKDASAIRAYFSDAFTDGEKIADELLAHGWDDGYKLTALCPLQIAGLKSQLPGLDLVQLGNVKMAFGAFFG